MILSFADGEPFAVGSTDYLYRPAAEDISPRIILQVEIEGILLNAIVDTGAPYVVCAPGLARQMSLQPDFALDRIQMAIRGLKVRGHLHRLNMTFLASQGESLTLEATVFVPDEEWEANWGEQPSFIGLSGCLERLRFAVDPTTDTFYFGAAQ
jgi:hypothetical protein